ncbi:CAMP-dependent kinase, regulatory protein (macronuclear) [Tetrahymena thermophila SB210]|uniref:cAMP-dependent protein kinase regulatory subunit n=1 Tax=Tetrahymena thermophila (strain SB210) TaxID=312017 RepID=Q22NC5_TETTS|nr:CAMP-dependent kinase, regulatory protein [Tetrahymena thermophila SB210]EAR86860.2 CAMP-dependent kinase, regulatory protein [Tetrahymena thermophila SB210]|eukprot:XP_001007105.2 CAMP-dependent kinase, regulatory protein [Tetrahymena thermophila SB210]
MSVQSEQGKKYLSTKVTPIFEKLVVELVKKQPEQVVPFMIQWLTQNQSHLEGGHHHHHHEHSQNESASDSDDESVEDLVDPQILIKQKQGKTMRTSVSAEAYGQYNQKSAFVAKNIPKNANQVLRIKQRLSQAFMFQSLDENEQRVVIGAMEEKKFKAGETIIKQGDDGDELYVVDSGLLDCYKEKANQEKILLKTYKEGEAFGELALLYNAPRAATIIAKTDCILFSLDRPTFNHIVKDAAAKKREKYEAFLSKVEILHDMIPYERLQIADALHSHKFSKGDYIVKEGENGNSFFILEEGIAVATKVMQAGQAPVKVYEYKSGDYFGEIALLKNQTRAANVIAESDCTVVSMDRESFKRLLGPLEDILRRNFHKYEKYIN